MVPFSPSNFPPEDFRQYRTEFAIHPKVHDAFPTPQFYSSNSGSLWDSSHVHHYSIKGETSYESAQNTSNITGSDALYPSAHAFAPAKQEFGDPQSSFVHQAFTNGILQEINHRCEQFATPNYCLEYGTGCAIPSTSQNMVDLDLELLPRTASPNSTISGSEMGSVGFGTHERICNHTTVEPDKLPSDVLVPPSAFFLSQNNIETAEGGSKIWKASQRKTATITERDLERRRKNNEASRKSRAQRKDRFLMNLREVEFLKIENQRLKDFLIELELVIKEANDALISNFKYRLPTTSSPVS